MARYSNGKIIAGGFGSRSISTYGFNTGGEKAYGLYNSPYSFNNFPNFRNRPYVYAGADTEKSFNASERSVLVSLSRILFAQMPILDFALEQIAEWSIGSAFDIVYTGPDKKFKAAFEDFANNVWAKNCNVLGPAFDFKTTLKLLIKERLRDGDLLQVYEFSRQGLPQLRYVRSHRIAQRSFESVIKGGRYDGYNVQDGCVKNSTGQTIGYYIQDPLNKDDDYIINARDASLVFNPIYFDKGR